MKANWLIGGIGLGFGLIVAILAIIALTRETAWNYSLDDENPVVRAAAIRNGAGNDQDLINRLNDEDADIRLLAAMRLGYPGSAPRASALVRALTDPHKGVRVEAIKSLAGSGPAAWPALRDAMASENRDVRWGAVGAFTILGRHDKQVPDWFWKQSDEIAPVIEKLLDDTDPEIREAAKSALKIVRWKR